MTSGVEIMEPATGTLERLLEAARSAAAEAYAPYSRFRVGAAVLAGGEIFTGSNIENASYGLTICAERTAIFNAVTKGHRKIEAIAVSCVDAGPDASHASRMPCGACRQVIAEFGHPETPVFVDGVGRTCLAQLLPEPFDLGTSR
ncbi:MAG TPA: cytidine deaminase [Phycisphaerae bacterium]|nr:cytidine deaminase [Phycisphaerae bacterium]